jgi:mono/diheme cytochrome c family protein
MRIRSPEILLWLLAIFGGGLLLLALSGRGGAEEKSADPSARRDPLRIRVSDEGDPGQAAYRRYCAGCHGVKGDGQGPAAGFLFPKPRDFTRALFKFGSTSAGSLPLDEDLLRTINRGLHGTAMPGWSLLPPSEQVALVRTIKGFSENWRDSAPPAPIPFYQNPFPMDDPAEVARAVTQGEKVYHVTATCWSCHPAYVSEERLKQMLVEGGKPPNARPDLGQTLAKPDQWGQEIPPADFPRVRLKSVDNLQDLYRVIMAGVGGTAMPSWELALKPEEIWALTLYVDSIRKGGSTHPGRK